MLVAFLGLLTHIYFVLRYEIRWIEWDTAATTRTIAATISENSLSPSIPYQSGFGYQAFTSIICQVVDVAPQDIQQIIMPLSVGILPAILAAVFFRSILGRGWAWAAAGAVLCIQPELILTTSRGSHEKITLIMTVLILLMLSISLGRNSQAIPYGKSAIKITILIAIATLALTNAFFAFSVLVSLVAGFSILRYMKSFGAFKPIPHLTKFIAVAGFLMVGAVIILYAPASSLISVASSYTERFVLILSGELTEGSPYASVSDSWSSQKLWIASNLLTFAIMVISIVSFLGIVSNRKSKIRHRFVANLYMGVSFMLLFAITLDFIGGGSIENLQIRWLPIWAILAVPMCFVSFAGFRKRHRAFGSFSLTKVLTSLALSGLLVISPLSLMRATLDPNVSNVWMFYSQTEESSVEWIDDFGIGDVWGGVDYRIGSIHVFSRGYPKNQDLRFITAETPNSSVYMILSSISIEQEDVREISAYPLHDWNCILSTGDTSIRLSSQINVRL